MAEVGKEFTMRLDMGDAESVGGTWGIGAGEDLMVRVEEAFGGLAKGGFHQAVVAALVQLHTITKSVSDDAAALGSSSTGRTFLSPRDYLALIHNFVTCVNTQREKIEDEQLHVNAGLSKLQQTQENVAELKTGLAAKTVELREKETLANSKLQQVSPPPKKINIFPPASLTNPLSLPLTFSFVRLFISSLLCLFRWSLTKMKLKRGKTKLKR
jgi:dynein heavy chain 1